MSVKAPKMIPEQVVTRDRQVICFLRSRKHVPLSIALITNEDGREVLLYTFDVTSWEDYEAYMRGEPMPIADVRDYESADREFRNNLFRFTRK